MSLKDSEMRYKDYLYSLLMEELVEAAQAASKVVRFSKEHVYNGKSNFQRLKEELTDVTTILHLLEEEGDDLATYPDLDKIERVQYYYEVGQELRDDKNVLGRLFELAKEGRLPKGFNQYHLAGVTGWSVGHVAAFYETLPDDFIDWTIADCQGISIAHVTSSKGEVPLKYSTLEDHNGLRVSDVFLQSEYYKELNDECIRTCV
jgi:NTP pyrophosphatase (non-canonical NTP hydrolase)